MRLLTVAASLVAVAVVSLAVRAAAPASGSVPETIHFASMQQQRLVGYLFLPAKPGRVPALVLLHGRAGPYSTLAGGTHDATTLSKRHMFWGRFWADRGNIALLVDSFGARGYPEGFPVRSYDDRPDAVNEVTVRPLDAYGALAYLRSRPDVDPERIALQGWSNGGSAALATMADSTLQAVGGPSRKGFVGALAFYPACGLHDQFKGGYRPYAPIRVFSGDDDEEVSAERCKKLVDTSHAAGADIAISIYPGATHDFDDPGKKRQSVEANVTAAADAVARSEAFIKTLFGK